MNEDKLIKDCVVAIFALVDKFNLQPEEKAGVLISIGLSLITSNVCFIGDTHELRVEILDYLIDNLREKINEVKDTIDKKHFMAQVIQKLKKGDDEVK